MNKISGFNTYFDRLSGMDRYFIMQLAFYYKGYYLDEYLYHVNVRSDSDHRSVNLSDRASLRKLISHDVYLELKRQRLENGADWLEDKNFFELNSFEQKLLNDRLYINRKICNYAALQIDFGNFKKAFSLLLFAIRHSPFAFMNIRVLFYLTRAKLSTFQ